MDREELLRRYAADERDFSEFNLSHINLSGADLSGAVLIETNLSAIAPRRMGRGTKPIDQ